MDYGEILKKAWKIVWKHKILWLFGLLASCGTLSTMHSGGGGGGSAAGSSGQANFLHGYGSGTPLLSVVHDGHFQELFQNIAEVPDVLWVAVAGIAVIVLITFALILSILFLFLGTLGTVGVIKGTCMADEADPSAKPLSFGTIFKATKPFYWKVFLLDIGYRVGGAIFFLLFFLPMILLMVSTCGLGLILVIPIFWLVRQMMIFTTIAIVEEKLPVFEAIERAWQLIAAHLGQVLLMFLILAIGQFIVGLVFALPLLSLPLIPALISLIVTGGEITVAGLVISVILFLLFIPLVIVLSAILQAYVLASWTLTYRRLAQEEELAPQILSQSGEESAASD